MTRRTIAIAGIFGRISCWLIGTGLVVIGFGEAINAACMCRQAERDG